MANIIQITNASTEVLYLLLKDTNKVFLQSENINVFPCSRRGQYSDLESVKQYDPEARLNTERTNRLHTAVNGFKDSFIKSFENNTLKFILAGYWVEVKNFNPATIAAELDGATDIYACLSLHPDVSLKAENYYTEILARQLSTTADTNYLDISYASGSVKGDFFIGISFVKTKPATIPDNDHYLHLFSKSGSDWLPVQTSLLPKIEHGETEDSIKVSGDFTVNHDSKDEFKVTDVSATLNVPTTINNTLAVATDKLTVTSSAAEFKVPVTISGATLVNNTITAKKLVITDITTGTEKGEVRTPQLRVNRITSDEGSITLDGKKLIVNKSLEMLAKAEAAEPAEATIEKAIIGDLTVKADTKLKDSTGKITTLNLQATNNATIYDLDVGTNIDTGTLIATSKVDTPTLNVNTVTSTLDTVTVDKNLSVVGQARTPTLKTNTITSDASEIAVDKPLKVEDNINVGTPATPATADNGGYIVAKKDITAEQDLVAKRDIKASAKATVKSLVVGERVSGDSETAGVITAKALVRTPKMEVNEVTSPNTSIVFSKALQLDKGFFAKEASTATKITATKITANELWLEKVDKTSIGQVPALEIAQVTDDTYQLRFKFGSTPLTIKDERPQALEE